MPVMLVIGSAATQYPILRRCGHHLYANQIRTRRNYVLKVAADTGSFIFVGGYICTCNCGTVASLPAPTPSAENAVAALAGKKAVGKDA